nr:hypothetical protein [Tanacetum cinerariifolium]
MKNLPKIGETHALSKPVTSNSVSTPQESKGVDNTKTRRPQPRSNTKNNRFPLRLRVDVISNIVCAMCKKCLISVNHDKCLCNYVNGKNSCGKKQKANDSFKENQMKYQPKVAKPKKVESHKSLATPKPRKSRLLLRWSPTGRLFNQEGKIVYSSESESQFNYSNGNLKLLINFVWKFMGTVHFGNDHVAAILGFGQFCDSDLEVAFRRDACFVRNLEGVDLLKGDRSTNLYTINLIEMTSASPICLMGQAFSTKSWLWHQRLSHLNFDTINDLARNDLVAEITSSSYGFVWTNENCQYKWKAVCFGDCGRLLSLHVVLKEFFDTVGISHQMSYVQTPQQNGVVERQNQTLVEAARTMLIFSHALLFLWAEAIATACFTQNRSIIHPMAFEQRSSKPRLQSMTSRQISSGLDLTYAPSTITTQQPSEGEFDLLFEAMYDDYIGGQPSATRRIVPPTQEPQVRHTSTASTSIADTAPTPTNSSSLATNILITSQDIDELNPNDMVDGNTFVNPFAISSTSAAASSSLQNMDPSNMHTFYQPYPHEFQ